MCFPLFVSLENHNFDRNYWENKSLYKRTFYLQSYAREMMIFILVKHIKWQDYLCEEINMLTEKSLNTPSYSIRKTQTRTLSKTKQLLNPKIFKMPNDITINILLRLPV